MRGLVAIAGSVALAASAGAAPRARATGHVVEIVRHPRGPVGTPRLCALQADSRNGASGQCYGPAPRTGELVTMLDNQHVLATVRLTSVTPYSDGGCSGGAQWVVSGTPISGQLSWQVAIGVIDVTVDPRTGRQLSVDRSPTGHAAGIDGSVIGIDSNGDGNPEVEFVNFPCDDTGASNAGNAPNLCVEVWTASGRGFTRVRQDKIRNCF